MGSPSAFSMRALGFLFNSEMLAEQFASTAFMTITSGLNLEPKYGLNLARKGQRFNIEMY
jgi:hypothetical protein